MTNQMLTIRQVAEVTGLQYSTLRVYRAEGRMPEPDDYIDEKPLWRRATIEKWNGKRPRRVLVASS